MILKNQQQILKMIFQQEQNHQLIWKRNKVFGMEQQKKEKTINEQKLKSEQEKKKWEE